MRARRNALSEQDDPCYHEELDLQVQTFPRMDLKPHELTHPDPPDLESNEPEQTRVARRTGPRPKQVQHTDDLSARDQDSTRPDAFRKPFASLPPTAAFDDETGVGARSLNNSHALSAHSATVSRGTSISPRAPAASRSSLPLGMPRRDSLRSASIRPKNARTYCNAHKLARDHQGQCMLCEKKARDASGGLNWPIPVLLMAVAVFLGAAIAAYL